VLARLRAVLARCQGGGKAALQAGTAGPASSGPGLATTRDKEIFMRWIRPVVFATLAGLALLAHADALQDGLAAVNRKDWPEALRQLEPLAKGGNPAAQLQLGLLHYHGHGVRESDAQARQWFEKAARQGSPQAQFQLANMYAYGLADLPEGADPYRVAAQWYFEAARQGLAEAQYSLGILFLTGSGVQQSPDEAQKWIRRAADQGHADAKAYLAGGASGAGVKAPVPAPTR
jgi:TPR repeat protein